MLVVGFERRRPADLSQGVTEFGAKPTRKAVSGPRRKPISVEDTALSKQRQVVMANMKTQPVDWEAFLAGFAGGKTGPAPHGSCPSTTGVSNFEQMAVRF
jgi:hypothetical protein